MAYITVEVDPSEVIDDLDDQDLIDELDARFKKKGIVNRADLIEQIYLDYRGKCESQALRDYIYHLTGKIL